MDKLIKKALHTAVGIVAGTTERLQHAIDDLVAKGKITAEEGRKVVDDVTKTTDYKKEEYEGKFKNLIDSVISKLNFRFGNFKGKHNQCFAASESSLLVPFPPPFNLLKLLIFKGNVVSFPPKIPHLCF